MSHKPLNQRPENLLEDYFEFTILPDSLVESAENGRYRLKGVFGLVGKPTSNKRIYLRERLQKEIDRIKPDMLARGVYSELEHPGDGKSDYHRSCAYLIDVYINEKDEIIGCLEFISGTKDGDQCIAIAKTGGRFGVSSRGFGTVTPDGRGNFIVNEDFKLVTWDVVSDPANANAFPRVVIESKENNMTLEEFKAQHPELYASLKESLTLSDNKVDSVVLDESALLQVKEVVKNAILTAIGERSSIEESDDSDDSDDTDYTTDVENSDITESLFSETESKLEEQSEEIERLKKENAELVEMAKGFGFSLYLEKSLSGTDEKNYILESIGDVNSFENIDELKEKLSSILGVIIEKQKRADIYNRKIKALEESLDRKQVALEKATELARSFAVKAYIEEKISGDPRSELMRRYVTEANPTTSDEVDSLVESFEEIRPVSSDFVSIRRSLNRTKKSMIVENKSNKNGEGIFGISFDELNSLSK